MPAVSVVIPAYNVERTLREALDSVLAQTWRDLEAIVVDDGSTDSTGAIARAYGPPVRTVRQENAGPSAARNRGVREARGAFVAFLDADDRWLPGKLAAQMPLFDPAGRVGLVYCRFRRIGPDGEALPTARWPAPTGRVYYRMLERSYVPASTPVVRKACFERAGLFPEDLSWAEDWHLWIRIARHYEFALADAVLVEHREVPGGLWAQRSRAHQGVLEVLARTARDSADRRTRALCRRGTRRARRDYALELLRDGQWAAGRRALLHALRRWPFDARGLAALGLALLPGPLRQRAVTAWRARPRAARPQGDAS